MSKQQLPIGIDDFKLLRTANYYYADKSLFIKELIDAGQGKVTLIPRPRRFGKTLNMTMLRYFFERYVGTEPEKRIFEGLEITKHPVCMAHQGRYPIIFLTFKDVKENSWPMTFNKIKTLLADVFRHHRYLLESAVLDNVQKRDFEAIITQTADQTYYENSLKDLSAYLTKHYDIPPVILIDEYDSPIHAGFAEGYYDDVISFMRGLMCGGLKGNTNVAYGVVTGILRVSKESIFSGMNNLNVHTLLSSHFADKFGLTEHEVKHLLTAYQLSSHMENVHAWYNGYRVGQPQEQKDSQDTFTMIYNPWSLLNFVYHHGVFGPYWVNTSNNKLVQDLIRSSSEDVKKDLELILLGKSVKKTICEDVAFPSIYNDFNALWSFLVFTGYLTWQARERMQVECHADLMVPNYEVLACLKKLVRQWFTQTKGSGAYQQMLAAIAQGDVNAFERSFQLSVLDHMSFFDTTDQTPERVYHAYVLGWLVGLEETHEVKSNRESGLGRYDVCVIPRDISKPASIIEFKVFDPKKHQNMEAAAQEALEQIKEKRYEVELHSRGIKRIVTLAIVFDGKRVLILPQKSVPS